MTNQEIDRNVRLLADSYLQGVKTRPQDKPLVEAGLKLLVNFLQNINDIAYAAIVTLPKEKR